MRHIQGFIISFNILFITVSNIFLTTIFQIPESTCPSGYQFQAGDKVGNPTEIERRNAKEIDECGIRCNKNQKCKSIEWSDSEKSCVLLTAESTDGPKWKDYRFCSKING